MKKLTISIIIICIILFIYFLIFKIIDLDTVVLKKIYPLKYCEYVEKYSKEYNIDPYLAYAIIKAESNFKEDAESTSNAIGLMQITKSTAFEIAEKMKINISKEDLYKPELNINIGLKYFRNLLDKYDNNVNLAIIAYNAGIGNVDKWIQEGTIKSDGSDIENVPFKETNNYARKILRDYEIYMELYK